MKKLILFVSALIIPVLIIEAQIYTPSGTIQGSSGNGNVGIGTASPYRTLHVFSQSTPNQYYDGELQVGGFVGTTNDVTMSIGTNYTNKTMFLQGWRGGYGASVSLLLNPIGGNVGIGTTSPQAIFHTVSSPNTIGTILNSNCINADLVMRYVALSFDGDYGNGSGNASQIRSYSNLYSGWGSQLAFYTTGIGGNGVLERMRIDHNGYVGIGTSAPASILHIHNQNLGTGRITMSTGASNAETYSIGQGVLGLSNGGFSIIDLTNNITRLAIQFNTGNVAIGIPDPGNYRLNVAGRIRADEVVVNTTGADFVFDPDYKLPGISEVEKFIKENRHLPDFESANEMKENGMSISEMQTKMLQKLEEMTLYIIELKKENEALKKDVNDLKRK